MSRTTFAVTLTVCSITEALASSLRPVPLHVRALKYDSPEYHAARELRRRFLREPLGLRLTSADVAGEDAQHHFGLFTEEPGSARSLVGVAIGKPDAEVPGGVRLRQVAVHADHRGQGLGRLLMSECEHLLAEYGYDRFILYARGEAVPFYDRCGYASTGDVTELIGMPHHRMEKRAH
ncbi:MAG: GNAT family N-acetyltransferase [Planctomycetota bacterium]